VSGVLHRLLLAPLLDALGGVGADAAGRAGAALGVLAFHLGLRRRVVADNLGRALGLRGAARRAIGRRAFASMGANFLELWTFGHPHAGPERGMRRLNPLWQELMHRRHPGAVFLALHLGSWDVAAGSMAAVSGPFLVYAKAQRNAPLDAMVNRQRARAGMDVLLARHGDRTGAVSVLRALRGGRPVGLLADQKPSGDEGRPAWFLGQGTPCHAGPAFFASRAKVPLIPGFCIREGAGRYAVFYGRPIVAGDEDALLQAGMDRLSAVIAAFPGQYLWHHRRFKRAAAPPPRAVEPWRARGLRLLVDRDDARRA
jgi:KDO2-lipid IV(A) lauroyltransferase